MTLTELRYLVTLAQERHFGRAAERCHVAQPTLSVAVKKLEDSLGLSLFERHRHGVLLTPAAEALINQAQIILSEVDKFERMADQSRDEFAEPLRLGAIFTVGPYLFPSLVRRMKQEASPLKLYLEENYTHVLDERLARGDLDAILVALPFGPPETRVTALFDEPFRLLLPRDHVLTTEAVIPADVLASSPVLMLGEGHCFRDQVLETCQVGQAPGVNSGSSLMTLRHMVASGLGITLIPASAQQQLTDDELTTRPILPCPHRRIVLASRHRFSRPRALQELLRILQGLNLPGTDAVDH
jgi:LysR family hydrogen peroxide-inducible transcriptional activator